MISVEMLYSSSSDDEVEHSIFNLSNEKFVNYFRLSKLSFRYVLNQIMPRLKVERSNATSATIKLGTTLRFLAQGSYQVSVGNDFNITLSQPTVSRVITECLDAMEEVLCPLWIHSEMTDQEKEEAKEEFYTKAGFPGVIGCVDGTHIRIIAPEKSVQHLYYNRKGFYSMNAVVVCDHKMRIRYLDARYPGSTHDSAIWNMSDIRALLQRRFESGDRNSWLLGDAGYPLEPFIMTPYRSAQERSLESRYNVKHSKTRNIVERVIGRLKSRFRCLLSARQLHYTPSKATIIANVCAALHNICENDGTDFPDEMVDDSEFATVSDELRNANRILQATGIRNRIRDNL